MWSLGRYLTNNIKRCSDVVRNRASACKTQVMQNAGESVGGETGVDKSEVCLVQGVVQVTSEIPQQLFSCHLTLVDDSLRI